MATLQRCLSVLLATVVLSGVLGELTFRSGLVRPRVVILRMNSPDLHVFSLRGRWVWIQDEERTARRPPGDSPRIQRDCESEPGVRRVALFGDSIFFGSGLSPEDALGARLEEVLRRRHPEERWCVMNLAQPAATMEPQLGLYEDLLDRAPPDLVVWQMGYGSPGKPVRLGDSLYYLVQIRQDAEGFPVLPGGLTGAWHRWLFQRSAFWEYLSLAWAPTCEPPSCEPRWWDRLVREQLDPAVDRARERGVPVVIATMVPLDIPFADQRASPVPWFDPVIAYADAEGIAVVRAEDVMGDRSLEEVRLDPCCHYNADGTRVLAEGLAPVILQSLAVDSH